MTDLCHILRQPEYFCPGLGGVIRDVSWLARRLRHYGVPFEPDQLAAALTQLIQAGMLRLTLLADNQGGWYEGFILVEETPT